MKNLRYALLFAAFALPALAHAEDTCPVMNRATAGGILAAKPNEVGVAEAALAIEWHTPSDYVCTFTVDANSLRIVVGPYHARDGWPSYTQQCFAKSAVMQAIGNEAVACYSPDGGTPLHSEAISHVRDIYLDVQLTFPSALAPDPAKSAALLREYTHRAAEIVAGNLF